MSINDFIGFIIGFVALVIMFIRRQREMRQAHPHAHEEVDAEAQESVEEFLRQLEGEEEQERASSPNIPLPPAVKTPPPLQQQKVAFKSSMDGYRLESAIEQRKINTAIEGRSLTPQMPGVQASESYEVYRMKAQPSRGMELIASMGPRKMLIIKELFGKPLSMREPNDPLRDWQP